MVHNPVNLTSGDQFGKGPCVVKLVEKVMEVSTVIEQILQIPSKTRTYECLRV